MVHVKDRVGLLNPVNVKDAPPQGTLEDERVAEFRRRGEAADKDSEVLRDNWRNPTTQDVGLGVVWTGSTTFWKTKESAPNPVAMIVWMFLKPPFWE